MATLGGRLCSTASLTAPQNGLWILDAECERGEFPVESQVSFSCGQDVWFGWVESHDTWLGTSRVRVVGGRKPVRINAESYQQCLLSDVVTSILKDGGQRFVLADLPVQTVPLWGRMAGPYQGALNVLCHVYGVNYLALPDGAIWCGVMRYPQVSAVDGVFREDVDLRFLESRYSTTRLAPYPNSTYDGSKIRSVTYELNSEKMTARCHLG